jgi:ABC-type dipeptide/oligopeptide/nickel transport system permease component
MRIVRFATKRLLATVPLIVGVTVVTFLLVRLLPGNPAYQLAGPFATDATRAAMERRLGLDRPLIEQYVRYVSDLARGDWGQSWFTARPVTEELWARLPATLELITLAIFIIVFGGLLLGLMVAIRGGGLLDRLTSGYGLLAGAFPDFWLGLVLSYIFFFVLGWLPGPTGRVPTGVVVPDRITGMHTVDTLLVGDFETFWAVAKQLLLPVLTLVIVYMSGIAKLARSVLTETLRSDMAQYARVCGLRDRTVMRYALKNSLPPVLTLVGLTYAFLLGGAVLVETVFAWGGLGEWVVNAIGRSDYFPVQAFVLAAALVNIVVYLCVDIAHVLIDPRIEY